MAARRTMPATHLIPAVPRELRTHKGTGYWDRSNCVRLSDNWTRLIWAEPVGDRLVVVFDHAHDGAKTHVGVLNSRHRFEALIRIDPYLFWRKRGRAKWPFPDLPATKHDDQLHAGHAERHPARRDVGAEAEGAAGAEGDAQGEGRRGLAPAPARRAGEGGGVMDLQRAWGTRSCEGPDPAVEDYDRERAEGTSASVGRRSGASA